MIPFEPINKAYNRVFQPGTLSVGLVVPIEAYAKGPVPTMQQHLERVKLVEALGFKAIWIRDIPLHIPAFGDAGQTFDPFTYLGYLAGQTSEIALGVASIALPLHHPVHVAKSAATIGQLSGGRLIMGVASGDRYEEYPGLGLPHEKRGELFREAFTLIRQAQTSFPVVDGNHYGQLDGHADILPKPFGTKIPLMLTGFSRQSLEWNAEHADGWMSYPKNIGQQQYALAQWRALVAKSGPWDKPFMQPLYLVLDENDNAKPLPIQLGFRIGVNHLVGYFEMLQDIGVNHVAINLRFNTRNMEETLEHLADKLLPHFHSQPSASIST